MEQPQAGARVCVHVEGSKGSFGGQMLPAPKEIRPREH